MPTSHGSTAGGRARYITTTLPSRYQLHQIEHHPMHIVNLQFCNSNKNGFGPFAGKRQGPSDEMLFSDHGGGEAEEHCDYPTGKYRNPPHSAMKSRPRPGPSRQSSDTRRPQQACGKLGALATKASRGSGVTRRYCRESSEPTPRFSGKSRARSREEYLHAGRHETMLAGAERHTRVRF